MPVDKRDHAAQPVLLFRSRLEALSRIIAELVQQEEPGLGEEASRLKFRVRAAL